MMNVVLAAVVWVALVEALVAVRDLDGRLFDVCLQVFVFDISKNMKEDKITATRTQIFSIIKFF
jgi:hypothetical protein